MDKNKRFTRYRLYFICTLIAVFSQLAYAAEPEENELELAVIADLTNVAFSNDQWHTVLPVLGDKNRYFIATNSGKIYQLNNNKIAQSPFFDLKSALSKRNITSLTAITLDPNFNYRERDGYHTFYTAHTESSKKTKQKLAPVNTDIKAPYDSVVIRWQLTYQPDQMPKYSQQREVIRIAIQQPQEHIQQLSFNPYIEPWHDDFGLLFIALSRNEALKNEPLYAGTILRIKPKKNGLSNYAIPANNPFIKNTDVANEIVFIAGQKIIHFDWIKKSTHSLLVQLKQQEGHILVQAKLGDDWRETIPQTQIKKHLSSINTQRKTLFYHGRKIKALWGKVLHLQQLENIWLLQASTLTSVIDNVESEQNTHYKLIHNDSSEQAQFSLHQTHNGELLLLEQQQQRLYTLKKPTTVISEVTHADDQLLSDSNSNTSIFILFTIALAASYFWYLRQIGTKKQNFLHEQWANFEVNVASKSLSMYKRHAKNAEKTMNISSIICSELLLNDEVISTINLDSTPIFSNTLEEQILAVLAKENQLKMIDDKQRKIQVYLTDDQQVRYLFCLYYRVGNIRHTKLKYHEVINKALDWQWTFAQNIAPDTIEKRQLKTKQAQPLIKAAIQRKRSDDVVTQVNEISLVKVPQSSDKAATNNHDFNNSADNMSGQNPLSENKATTVTHDSFDTEFVAALDRLVSMKKQGYLDEREFNIAKAKILKDSNNA
ncbi:hypothetical protein EKO29_19065 [Colwellia sp. Arc7-635]|uniref:hypothetical protein n=1 Tax=Colwellia sp. Arc7-635 TaxID=2497879 RepID=UPI000F8594DE|nr:hypothetical protein [Colwellia sp. Arc7-635]AZQ85911.1 hypothetical protein EKO29_19065 [Colwellia sp. Arc7-635]